VDDDLDFLEIQDLIQERNEILESEQPDEERLRQIQEIINLLY
jgi:hypothetical protein